MAAGEDQPEPIIAFRSVNAHTVSLNHSPNIWLSITVKRLIDFIKHGKGRVVLELKTVACERHAIKILNRIVKPARSANHRYSAVARAVHLVQPARLKERRHQENICARFNPVRERLVEAFVDTYLLRRMVAHRLKEIFILACA